MVAKVALCFCMCVFVAQRVTSQCIGAGYNGFSPYANGLALEAAAPWEAPLATAALTPLASEWGVGLRAADLAASNGRSFAVTSASPISPTGISMTSENAYDGIVAVTGAVPFLGAISLEGALPTAGSGAVSYGCGNGEVAILNEDAAYNGLAGPLAGPLNYNGYAGPMAFEAGPYNGIARNGGRGCGVY